MEGRNEGIGLRQFRILGSLTNVLSRLWPAPLTERSDI
jgi:hypothetical protein